MNKKVLGIIVIVAVIVIIAVILIFRESGAKNQKTIIGDWEYKNGGYTYHFNEDGTGTYMGTMKFTYTENNGTVKITYDGMDNSLEGTWEDDVLNIKDSFGSDTIYNRK